MKLENDELDSYGAKYKSKYEHIVNLIKVYDPRTKGISPYSPTLPQWAVIGTIIEEPNSRVQVITPTQYGKNIEHNTPVLLANGSWTTHGKLKVGDFIFSPTGKPIKISWTSKEAIIDNKIVFSNGEEIIAHDKHEWTVFDNSKKKYVTLETQEMVKQGVTRNSFILPKVCQLQFKRNKLSKVEIKKLKKIISQKRISIHSIEKCSPKKGKCIQVDSIDGLYLVGKKLIPTHNSLAVGISAMISAVLLGDKIAIVAPSTDKAKIIMDVAIDHLDDNPVFSEAVKLEKGDTIERIKKYRQKTRLNFSSGGEIRVYSADSRNKQATIISMMGFGARKVLVDESSLIDDDLYSTIKRMVGGYSDGFLFEIGNPFINNHFRRTWESDRYFKIFIDYKKALSENRYSEEFIKEMRDEEFFSVLYECKFPELDESNVIGAYKLLSPYIHLNLTTEKYNIEPNAILGIDVARAGNDSTVFVKRGNNYARVVWRKKRTKLDEIAMMIVRFIKGGIPAENVFIDETGMGGYLVDFLVERGYNIMGVRFNQKSSDQDRFLNIKAEMYREMKFWLDDKMNMKRKCLVGAPALWRELSYLTYSFSSGRMKMTSKDELKTLSKGKSPDIADALALTFAYPRTIYKPEKEKSITEQIWDADMQEIENNKINNGLDPIEKI